MKYQTQFNKVLEKLWRRRVVWLHAAISGRKPGPPLTFDGPRRNMAIKKLQKIASKALTRKLAKREFEKAVGNGMRFKKGHGVDAKKENFDDWRRRKVPEDRGKVYVFFAKQKHKCLYVGRTTGRGGRPKGQFKRDWFRKATRIVVYSARDKKSLPRLECLAIHLFDPRENKIRASRKRWTSKCPLCKIHKGIRTELRQIFSLPIRLFKT